MSAPIQSTKNPLVRRFRDAARGQAPGFMVAEGRRLAAEVVAGGLAIHEVAWSPKLLAGATDEALLRSLTERAAVVHECSDKVLERLSTLATHQGISLIVRQPVHEFAALLGPEKVQPLIVVAAGVRDPGNLGALVRSGEAAGATGMITTDGSADPYRDKALRGSAGSALRLPIRAGLSDAECVEAVRRAGAQLIVAADVADAVPCWDVDLRGPTALCFGAEGAGVSQALTEAADARVVIPLAESVESLNVAVAAGVLLFEARRQRR